MQNGKGKKRNAQNYFQSQVNKLSGKTTSLIPKKTTNVNENKDHKDTSTSKEVDTSTTSIEEVLLTKIDLNPTIGLTINTAEVLNSRIDEVTNESINKKPKDVSQLTQKIKRNGIQHEIAKGEDSKLPLYLNNLLTIRQWFDYHFFKNNFFFNHIYFYVV